MMPTAPLYTDDLLDPVAADRPAGVDLRWTPEWDRIKEARRADDDLELGQWIKKERKLADWPLVRELATTALREQSKDLQIAMWLTEANIRLHGWAGLRDGLRIVRELLVRYWDAGLYPPIEDGPEDRAGPLQWLNDKLVDSVRAILITARSDGGADYTFIDLEDARRVGSEAAFRKPDGEVDSKKKKEYEAALASGRISLEMFERAITETSRAAYEELCANFKQAHIEFQALEKVIDDRFGDAAPVLSAFRAGLRDIEQTLSDYLEKKRRQEPDPTPAPPLSPTPQAAEKASWVQEAGNPVVVRYSLPLDETRNSQSAMEGSWQEAEVLIRSGQVERGLAQMTRLAATETTGRSRFCRKLLLAEICLATNRDRLARSILEELAEQIDKCQLEAWESSELIGSVWTKLFRLYKQDPSENDRAAKLYERLCRLDPWQALSCSEE
jgi:type VI secretion system protein ImpA